MKRFLTNSISTTVGSPVKKGTLELIQDAPKESISSVIIALIGSTYSTQVMYRLHGVDMISGATSTTFTSGAVFYNGEVYKHDVVSISNAIAGQFFFSVDVVPITSSGYDPTTLTDNSVVNAHIEYKARVIKSQPVQLPRYDQMRNIKPYILSGRLPAATSNITLDFINNYIKFDDPQSPPAALTFSCNLLNSVIGNKTTIYLGVSQSGTTLNFPASSTIVFILTNGVSNSQTFFGYSATNGLILECTYLGINLYNQGVIKVDVNYS